MNAKDVKWCPQHGYPLPCDKCGMPLTQPQQKEIYKAGINEVVEWVEANSILMQHKHGGEIRRGVNIDKWEAKRKGIFISVGATKGEKLFDGALLTIKYFFDVLDMTLFKSLLYRGLDFEGGCAEAPRIPGGGLSGRKRAGLRTQPIKV